MKLHKKKILIDSIFLTTGHFIKRFRTLIFFPVIISSVGLENYGAFVQILLNSTMIVPICTLALGMGFLRYTSQYDDDEVDKISKEYFTILTASLFLAVIGALIIYVTSPVINTYILGGKYLSSLKLSSLLVITNVLWTQNAKYLRSRKRFKLYSVYDVVYKLFPYIGFAIGTMLRNEIFYGLSLFLIIKSCILAIILMNTIKHLHRVLPSFVILKKFFVYSWALVFSEISGGLLAKIDRYFIGYFLGPSAIGVYSIVYSFVGNLDGLTTPFRNYFAVYLPRIWDQGEKIRVKRQLSQGLLYYLICCIGLLVIFTWCMKPFLFIILQKDPPHIDNFELLVLITGLGIICLGAGRFFYQIIRYKEQNYYILIFRLIAVMVNIILNTILIPEHGLIGASIATLVSYFVILIACNILFRINLNVIFVIKLIKTIIICLPIMLVFKYIEPQSSIQLLFMVCMYCVLYLLLLFITKVVTISELKREFF